VDLEAMRSGSPPKARAGQILDQIDEQGTDADEEKGAAREELKGHE
jgi:hypothetical protein